jgi:hypothetical protein
MESFCGRNYRKEVKHKAFAILHLLQQAYLEESKEREQSHMELRKCEQSTEENRQKKKRVLEE